MNWLTSIKLSVQQCLLITAAAAVAFVMLLLRSKNRRIAELEVSLLKSAFEKEEERMDQKVNTAIDRAENARDKYEKALLKYRGLLKPSNSKPSK